MSTERDFEVQGTVTWNGDDAIRTRGSTGKVREITPDAIYVSWGYLPDVPRDEQLDAEGWVLRRDLLPGFVAEDQLPERTYPSLNGDGPASGDRSADARPVAS